MPVESVLFLSLVIGALVVFAGALAYADWASRQALEESVSPKHSEKLPAPSRPAGSADYKKAA